MSEEVKLPYNMAVQLMAMMENLSNKITESETRNKKLYEALDVRLAVIEERYEEDIKQEIIPALPYFKLDHKFTDLMEQISAALQLQASHSVKGLECGNEANQDSVLADGVIQCAADKAELEATSDSHECEYFALDQACVKDILDAESKLVDASAPVDVATRCMCIGPYRKRYESELNWYYSSNLSSLAVIDTAANIARYHTALMLKKLYLVAEFLVYQPLREHIAAGTSFLIVTVYAPTRIFVCQILLRQYLYFVYRHMQLTIASSIKTACCWRKRMTPNFLLLQILCFLYYSIREYVKISCSLRRSMKAKICV